MEHISRPQKVLLLVIVIAIAIVILIGVVSVLLDNHQIRPLKDAVARRSIQVMNSPEPLPTRRIQAGTGPRTPPCSNASTVLSELEPQYPG
jgi:hypothetical protein